MSGKRLVSSYFAGGIFLAVRRRRRLVAVGLIALVSIFAARAAIHHVADDAASTYTLVHNQAVEHSVEFDAIPLVLAILLLVGLHCRASGALPESRLRRSPGLLFIRGGAPPPSWRPGQLRRAQLQCFLT